MTPVETPFIKGGRDRDRLPARRFGESGRTLTMGAISLRDQPFPAVLRLLLLFGIQELRRTRTPNEKASLNFGSFIFSFFR